MFHSLQSLITEDLRDSKVFNVTGKDFVVHDNVLSLIITDREQTTHGHSLLGNYKSHVLGKYSPFAPLSEMRIVCSNDATTLFLLERISKVRPPFKAFAYL